MLFVCYCCQFMRVNFILPINPVCLLEKCLKKIFFVSKYREGLKGKLIFFLTTLCCFPPEIKTNTYPLRRVIYSFISYTNIAVCVTGTFVTLFSEGRFTGQ